MRMRPRWNRLPLAVVAIAAGALLGARGVAAQEEPLPDWIPSIGLGPGIYSRAAEGTVDGFLKTGAVQLPDLKFQCTPQAAPNPGFCIFYDNDERDIDGAALGFSAQLMGPSAVSWPLRPRPFVQGAWVRTYYSRVLAESGFQPSDFDANGQEPDLQLEENADPQYLWYTGGGVALQLPFERPTFIKLGAHYMEERLDITGRILRADQVDNVPVNMPEARHKDELTVRSVGPDIGFEIEVFRFGPIAAQLTGDVLFSFPLNSVKNTFFVDQQLTAEETAQIEAGTQPQPDPAEFDYDAENVHYYGTIYIRFAWLGR